MKYVIHGATGAQGLPIVNILSKLEHDVIGLNRSNTNYNSVASLINKYEKSDGIFIHLPLANQADQIAYAQTISEALKVVRPNRIVISTSGESIDSYDSLKNPKTAIQKLIKNVESFGVSYAVVAPRLFQENLLGPHILNTIFKDSILHYPLNEELPISWVSHLDVAEVVTALFKRKDINGIINIGQFPPLTGNDLAKEFSTYLKKDIKYKEISPDDFGLMLKPLIGEKNSTVVSQLYKGFAKERHHSFDYNTSAQHILGLTPKSIQNWLQIMDV